MKHPATAAELAKTIDHAVLAPAATLADLEAGCETARRYNVASLCVRPADVARTAELLAGSDVLVSTVIGFPHGANLPRTKAFEAAAAVEDGAEELDMVLNIGRLVSGDLAAVEADITAVVQAAAGRCVKVILECALLSDEQKRQGCLAAVRGGAHYVKTSTGFASHGATVDDVALMRQVVGPDIGVKASGGIRSLDDAIAMISAGATRLGTSSTAAIVDAIGT